MEEDHILEDMVLLFLYIYSWKKNVADKFRIARSWKIYDALDSLAMKGHMGSSHKTKSVIITDVNLERQGLSRKYCSMNR